MMGTRRWPNKDGKSLWLVAVLLLLVGGGSGCAGLSALGNTQQNPLVQGAVSVATAAQCRQYAMDQPEQARSAGQYLSTLHGATAACMDGISAGLAE